LPFELNPHVHHVFLASSNSQNQKAVEFFKRRFLEKKKVWTIPHEKSSFLLSMDFLIKKDNKPNLKFHMKKVVLRIYRTVLRMLVSMDELPILRFLL
jgi:hypothetical protein